MNVDKIQKDWMEHRKEVERTIDDDTKFYFMHIEDVEQVEWLISQLKIEQEKKIK